MNGIIIKNKPDATEKMRLMVEDAKFEINGDFDAERTVVDCSEHFSRDKIAVENAMKIVGKASPPKVDKVFMASSCIFNCAYCGCRCGREDRVNYVNSPAEFAEIALNSAKSNGKGVFVTSAIYKNADYTQELLAESVKILRNDLGYKGYLHAKVMPGADPLLIAKTGQYADRLSVNIEVAHSSGYDKIAKQKTRENILAPMGNISDQISGAKYERRKFATSQTTQLMAGSTDENDRTIMTLSEALYKKYSLKRVYYTPFHYLHDAKGYEAENLEHKNTPYWRMARLYQADRLLQIYGFTPDDITPERDPFLHEDIDPKAAWAIRHLDMYPVEINKADFETLIRIPGIGITYAKRIIEARRHSKITHELMKKMKISLKRAIYFITCDGKYKGGGLLSSPDIRAALSSGYEQMSIFSSLVSDESNIC